MQGFNLLALYAAISELNTNPTSTAYFDALTHSSALLHSLLHENEPLILFSLITNSLQLAYTSYMSLPNQLALAVEINLFDNFIYLMNIALMVTEANRESDTNGFYNSLCRFGKSA